MFVRQLRHIVFPNLNLQSLVLRLRCSFLGNGHGYGFGSDKKEGPNQIKISEQDLQTIKRIVGSDMGEQKEGETFFKSKETQLSLQIIQISTIDQLKPIITKYDLSSVAEEQTPKEQAELIRCKFIILYKYIILGGSITDKQILKIYMDLATNVHSLDQKQLTIFYRIIAEEIKRNQESQLSTRLPVLPLIAKPSHCNAQLVSLLLMVYPQSADKIYINYHLVGRVREQSFREGVQQPWKQLLYDPVHLIMSLKHFWYYDDVRELVKKSLETCNVEESDFKLDQLIQTQSQLSNRKVDALCLALNEGYHQICVSYLFNNHKFLNNISISSCIRIAKAILCAKSIESYPQILIRETLLLLMSRISNRKQLGIELSTQEQLQQNLNFKNVIELLSFLLRLYKELVLKSEVVQVVKSVFGVNSVWRVKFQEFDYEEIFNCIVCYKGCRDLLNKSGLDFDENNHLFAILLTNLREEVLSLSTINQKQLFYVVYFADSFDSISLLKNERIVRELNNFKRNGNLNQSSLEIISKLIDKLNQ